MTTILLTTLFAVGMQFALAILGWGGIAPFFSHPQFVALAVATVLLSAVAPFSGGNLSPGEREDRGNRWVLGVFTVLALLIAYVPAWCDRHDFLTIGGESLRWAGVGLFAVGGVLRLWPVFVLGRRFSGLVAIQEGHTLVTTGIYRYVRNPSYLGLLLGVLGWALTFRSLLGIAIAVLMLITLIARMRAEERLLASQFGAEYERYRARTWRLVPGIY